MTAISGRSPEVWVSYNTPTGRKTKHFPDAHQAKSFYVGKFKAGNQPKIHKDNPMSDVTATPENTPTENTVPEGAEMPTAKIPTSKPKASKPKASKPKPRKAPSKANKAPEASPKSPKAKKATKTAKSPKRKPASQRGVPATAKPKAKAPSKAKPKASQPSNNGKRGRSFSPERLANMMKVLKILAKQKPQSDGLSQAELREKIGERVLGFTYLERYGLITLAKMEGQRSTLVKATKQGRAAAKKKALEL